MSNKTNESTEKTGGLEIEVEPRFQRGSWQFERAAWLIMAALSGLFGDGPVSRAESTNAAGTPRANCKAWNAWNKLNMPYSNAAAASALFRCDQWRNKNKKHSSQLIRLIEGGANRNG